MPTRQSIIARAAAWAARGVPYSMFAYTPDGWRTDCSGLVSMAWQLDANYWTGNLATVGVPLASRNLLLPGDMLLFHNTSNPHSGSHVVLFDRWVDQPGGDFWIYEETPPRARHIRWSATRRSNLSRYLPFRPLRLDVPTTTPPGGDDDMKIILGNIKGRSTVFSGLRGEVPLIAHTSEEATRALEAAGAVRVTFDTPIGLMEALGTLAGDPAGTTSIALIERAG